MSFYFLAVILSLAFCALGFGIFFSMKIFNIPDITTDGSYTLGGSLGAVLLVAGFNPWLALLLCLAAGFFAGCVTGLIHTRLKVNPLLSGILVMTGLYSINLKIMGKSNLALIDTPSLFQAFGMHSSENRAQFIVLGCIVMVLLFLIYYLLLTDFGLLMRATGSSEKMVRANGSNSQNIKTIGLGLSNALTALSGFLVIQVQGFADINMGVGIMISGLGAVIIAETLFGFTQGNNLFLRLILIVAGTLIFRFVLAFVLSQGIDPVWLKLATALIVLGIVALPGKKTAY
jgi:putative ABC transport system permease protein